jgi:HSP20 family protein
VRARVDRLFDARRGDERAWTPAVHVVCDNGCMVVRTDLPGTTPEEVTVEVEDNILTILGEHLESKEEKDKHHVRRERRHDSFSRSVAPPAGIDPTGIMVQTRDGVVEVTIQLPKQARRETVTITPAAP